jgi:hypothetical protein
LKIHSLIRRGPEYRSDAFAAGAAAAGYAWREGWHGGTPGRDDVLLIWNRYGSGEAAAQVFEAAGAQVLVAENGYIGRDANGRQLYALARSQHNGAGTWHVGVDDRWSRLGVELKPWRTAGSHILVCAQRGIGSPVAAQPHGWTEDVVRRLRQVTKREIRVRLHPETRNLAAPVPPLESELADCWAVVVWGSGAGIKALVAGVPVINEMRGWIGRLAASQDLRSIDAPPTPGFLRERMLHSLAWAQWTLDEIASGLPFRTLLATPARSAA